MIGHHYDIIYSYIDNLTRIYKPEEHFKLGQSKEVLYQIAESLGWTLANGQQATDLWKYWGFNQSFNHYIKSIIVELFRRGINYGFRRDYS